MQASVITVEIPAERFDALAATVHAQIVPAMRTWPGFLGSYWLGDQSEGLVRALVFADGAPTGSARGLQSSPSPLQIQDATLRAVGGRITGMEEYEVVARVGPRVNPTAQFCRSILWQEDPQQIEQVIRRIETGVIPGVRQNPGFQGGIWLVDRLSGRYMGFTLWDTAEHLEASGDVGRETRREPIQRGEMQVLGLQQYSILARADAADADSR
jgi:hypothetical protein